MLKQLRKEILAARDGKITETAPTSATVVNDDEQATLNRVGASNPRFAASLRALDPSQFAAVTSPSRALLVHAAVGSGKTAVLAHRVLWLREARGVPLGAMAALTFTQQAAQELIGRVQGLLETTTTADHFRYFGTFHGVARGVLARQAAPSGATALAGLTICDEPTAREVLAKLCSARGWAKRRTAASMGDLAKLRRSAAPSETSVDLSDITRLYADFQSAKAARGLVDFDDLMEMAAQRCLQTPEQDLPNWVLVDELQDSDPLELRFLAALRRPDAGLFAVGDAEQAIYGWRGSVGDPFATLGQQWSATALHLGCNYRSTPQIGLAARAVAGHQRGAGVNYLRGGGASVVVRQHVHTQMEGLYLIKRIHELSGDPPNYGSIAVLARTRDQLSSLRTVLTDGGVPCASISRTEVWADRPAAHWLLKLLHQSALGESASNLKATLTTGPYRLLPASALPAATVRRLGNQPASSPAAHLAGLTSAHPTVQQLLTRLANVDLTVPTASKDGAQRLWNELGLVPHLHPSHRLHRRDVKHVRAALAQLAAAAVAQGESWSQLAGQTLCERPQDEMQAPSATGVALLTFHAAKGLEFTNVFISGCNQGICPLAKAWSDRSQWLEERRLLYVAMTRARDTLEISWHTQPAVRGAMAMPSEWLLGLPSDVSQWLDQTTLIAAARAPDVASSDLLSTGRSDSAPEMRNRPTESSARPWSVGQVVRHSKYGAGTVTACDDAQVHVHFGKMGERSFSLLLCPLRAATDG
ncbi:MAG: ATP-dependent helicase [Myxococcales bacterium]|nr:ATP-dependent helicase [Myxococcales bacterium]